MLCPILAPPLLLQLPATITAPTKHDAAAEQSAWGAH